MSDNESSETMQYPNSQDDSRQLGVSENGDNWVYPSAAGTGYVQITLPAAHGQNPEEQLLIKDFGTHVAREVEQSLAPNPYPKASPRRSATETFRHYVGAAEGASLMDEGTLKRMADIASEFEATPYRQEYFEQVLKPYLDGLIPKRR